MAQNTSAAYRQLKLTYKETGPLILNCISGSDRSGVVALAIAALTATNSKRPILIGNLCFFFKLKTCRFIDFIVMLFQDPINVWYRICCQRKGALRDIAMLELSMQIVLANAHNLLNKREYFLKKMCLSKLSMNFIDLTHTRHFSQRFIHLQTE